jgi:mono/diheme cytochrome c family protein
MAAGSAFASGVRRACEILILLGGAMAAYAAEPGPAGSAVVAAPQTTERELIPGAESMTPTERETYRRRMSAAATPEEKAGIRAEYVKAAEKTVPAATLIGDPVRGAAVHTACFSCHGIERYTAPVTYAAASLIDSVLRASGLSDLPPAEPTRFKGRAKSLAELRAGVIRRNDLLNPQLTRQEIEDVVAYLNVTYYKFPQ